MPLFPQGKPITKGVTIEFFYIFIRYLPQLFTQNCTFKKRISDERNDTASEVLYYI